MNECCKETIKDCYNDFIKFLEANQNEIDIDGLILALKYAVQIIDKEKNKK
jgi:hypothetical protein